MGAFMLYANKKIDSIREGDILKKIETGELLPVQHFYSDINKDGKDISYIYFKGFSVPRIYLSRFFESTGNFLHVF
jgi:hypothetical protein